MKCYHMGLVFGIQNVQCGAGVFAKGRTITLTIKEFTYQC